MSQTSQSLKWKIQFFTPHLSPTRSDMSRLWYTLVALGQNNHQHLSWWFACLSHTQFHIPVKRRQGPRGWKPISCFCSIKTVWHTCSLSLWPAGSHRTGETWLNCEAMDRRLLFSPPLPFHFEADSSRFLTAAVTDWNLENMGNSRKRGKTNCFGFYSSNYSQLTPAWWLFVFLFTDTHLQTCYTWGIRFSWSIRIFFPTLLIVLDQPSDCENGRAPPFGWRFWPGNSSTVFNPSVRVSELHWWKESCFSRSGRK